MNLLLSDTWVHVLIFGAMNHGALLRVEAMEPRWILVHERVVLRHEKPSDFRRLVRHSGRGALVRCSSRLGHGVQRDPE